MQDATLPNPAGSVCEYARLLQQNNLCPQTGGEVSKHMTIAAVTACYLAMCRIKQQFDSHVVAVFTRDRKKRTNRHFFIRVVGDATSEQAKFEAVYYAAKLLGYDPDTPKDIPDDVVFSSFVTYCSGYGVGGLN